MCRVSIRDANASLPRKGEITTGSVSTATENPLTAIHIPADRALVAGNQAIRRAVCTLGAHSEQAHIASRRSLDGMGATDSVNDIRTAIRELSLRADLARKEGRADDAAELDQRIESYREKLTERP